ncbi:MAG TPA: hypothetical protein V6C58_00555, partial [Allocoleopsis sp.]
MKNLKISLMLAGSLVFSNASFAPLLAESVKTEGNNQPTITQQVKSDNREQYVIIPANKSINEAVVVQSLTSQQLADLTPSQKQEVRQVVPLKQYIALRGTKGLENLLVVKGTSVKTFENNLAQQGSAKDGDKVSKEQVNQAFNESAGDYVVIPQGKELSSEEMAKVEGEYWWIPVGGAVGGVAVNGYDNYRNGRPIFQNWGSSAV